jgi:hypothetical protein
MPEHSQPSRVLASADAKDARRRERAARRREESEGLLDPATRFRALLAAHKTETDFLELADKKARFALIIMSVLNAVVLLLVARGGTDLVPRSGFWGRLLQAEIAAYIVATAYYVNQAIEALRPRGKRARPQGPLPAGVVPGQSMRVLFHADIAARTREEYRRAWDELRLDNVNAELADQLHMVSTINVLKFDALARLYHGLFVMTVVLCALLLTLGASLLARFP